MEEGGVAWNLSLSKLEKFLWAEGSSDNLACHLWNPAGVACFRWEVHAFS